MVDLPNARRVLFSAILGLALWVLLEGGAWIAFLVLDGEAFSFERIAGERATRARGASAAAEGARFLDAKNQPGAVHPYLGYVFDVDAPAWKPARPDMVTRIEELGLDAPRRDPGVLLVVFLGGSVAEMFLEHGSLELARVLEADGVLRGRKLRILGASVAGWKQPQQLFALTWLLSLGCEPDVAIALDGFNEVALHAKENGMLGIFPAYPRMWSSRSERVPDPATRIALGRLGLATGERERWARRMEDGPWRWSIAANLLWRARDRSLKRAVEKAMTMLREKRAPAHSFQTQGPAFDDTDAGKTSDELVALWERSSRQMDQLCRAHDVRYLHFLQPNQYVEGSKPLSAEERQKCVRPDLAYLPGILAGYPRLREAGRRLAAAGEAFVDLTQVFAGVPETTYSDDACHLNRRGNEIIADRIAEAVAAALAQH